MSTYNVECANVEESIASVVVGVEEKHVHEEGSPCDLTQGDVHLQGQQGVYKTCNKTQSII